MFIEFIVQPFRAKKGVNRALLVTSMKIGTMVEFDMTDKMGYGAKRKKSNMAAKIQDGRRVSGSDIMVLKTCLNQGTSGKCMMILCYKCILIILNV